MNRPQAPHSARIRLRPAVSSAQVNRGSPGLRQSGQRGGDGGGGLETFRPRRCNSSATAIRRPLDSFQSRYTQDKYEVSTSDSGRLRHFPTGRDAVMVPLLDRYGRAAFRGLSVPVPNYLTTYKY